MVLSMKRPDDLHSVVGKVAEELRLLGVHFDRLWLGLTAESGDSLQVVQVNEDGSRTQLQSLDVDEAQRERLCERWKSGVGTAARRHGISVCHVPRSWTR